MKNKEFNESKGNPIINIKNNNIIAIQKNSGLGVLLKEPIKELLDIIGGKEKIAPPLTPVEKIDQNKFNKRLHIVYGLPDNYNRKVIKILGENLLKIVEIKEEFQIDNFHFDNFFKKLNEKPHI